jgi:uncharacterized protein DUF3850
VSAVAEPNSLHQVRIDRDGFRAVTLGLQNALVLPDALDVRVGDQVALREWAVTGPAGRGQYTSEWIVRRVTHVLGGGGESGITEGHRVVSLNNATENESATAWLRKDLRHAEKQGVDGLRYFELKAEAEARKRSLRQRRAVATV